MVIEADLADVKASREQQRGMTFGGLAARPVARVACVARVALALEGTLLVAAHLRAGARVQALVYVCE